MNRIRFQDMLPIGDAGVTSIMAHLKATMPHTLKTAGIVNKSNNRRTKYDIAVVSDRNLPSEIFHRFEVKADRHPVRYMFLETISQAENGVPGTYYNTPADYVIYMFFENSQIFIFRTADLRRWIEKKGFAFTAPQPCGSTAGDNSWTTWGLKVPIERLSDIALTTAQMWKEVVAKVLAKRKQMKGKQQ